MRLSISLILLIPFGLFSQNSNRLEVDSLIRAYMLEKSSDDTASIAHGTVGNGTLEHGKLVPYKGENFMYFDRDSYLEGRAFLHGSALKSTLNMYDSLRALMPNRYFNIMECSNEEGGELFPHRTHQNGLSIDFMMPLIKDGKPYYALDTLGAKHYTLNFDDDGKYTRDKSVEIDFNLMARQIVLLDYFARIEGLNVAKVILKIELKDELYNTEYGKILKERDIYVVQGLSPLINSLHDDHFHIDFEFTYPRTPAAESSERSQPTKKK